MQNINVFIHIKAKQLKPAWAHTQHFLNANYQKHL